MGRGFLSIAMVLFAASAQAGEADDAALLAYEVHNEICAAASVGATNTANAEQQALVHDAWAKVIAAYESTGRAYLLYWRGVLSQCRDQEDRAAEDLQLFIELEQFDDRFSALVKDARKRLRRMKIEVREPGDKEVEAARAAKAAGGDYSIARDAPALKPAREKSTVPFFTVGFGGGYQRLAVYNYALLSVDLSLKLKGPLRVVVGARPAWSLSWTTETTDADGNTTTTTEDTRTFLLFDVAVGVELAFAAGPVRPRVAALFHIAPNPSLVAGAEVLAGGALAGGIDVPLGSPAIALRLGGEIGNLGANVNVKVGGGFVVGMPGPSQRAR